MNAARSSRKAAAWSSYWSEGNITSLPNLFADNYSGDVLRFWNEAFKTLEENSRVLDICTGNGAVAHLAREYADRQGIRCEIHAIDVAEIQPGKLDRGNSHINEIRFRSGVAVESTHCRSDYFDLVVGQFALEYCQLPDAARELSRIMRAGGMLVLMMHHADSATARSTRQFIEVADEFLQEPTLFYRLRKYAEQRIGQKAINSRKTFRKRQQLMAGLSEADNLSARFPNNRFVSVTLDNIKRFVERIHGDPLLRIEEIRDFERTVQHHLTRVRDQRDASFDKARMSRLAALLDTAGMGSVQYEPYFLDDVLFAWTLRARLSDSHINSTFAGTRA